MQQGIIITSTIVGRIGMGTAEMYISAAPSENTIHFYFHFGCQPADEIDLKLFALERDDIYLTHFL